MGYEIETRIEVRARLEDCKAIGDGWVKAILTEIPTANELLDDLNKRYVKYDPSFDMKFIDWGLFPEISGDELADYYEFGADPLTINLWWGCGRAGIHIKNSFDTPKTISELSRKYPHAIFKIVEIGDFSGCRSHEELIVFGGNEVARIGGK